MAEENGNIKIDNAYIEVVNSSQVIQGLMKKVFPVKVSYWLSKAVERIKQEGKPYYEAKQKLAEKYGEQDNEGNVIPPGPDGSIRLKDTQGFIEELQELQTIEVDLGIKKIKLDMDDPKCPDLSVEEMRLLLPLIEEME